MPDIEAEIAEFEAWFATIPPSEMVYPLGLFDRLKYFAWRHYTPYHASVRDSLTKMGIVWHEGRQDFLLGTLAPGQTIKDFVEYLVAQGYRNHFVAWRDADEVASLRYVENFTHQYHLRVFKDREVRGHYEFTPEYKPVEHMRDYGMEERRELFLELLGDRIVK